MLGFVYLILCFVTGFVILTYCFPGFRGFCLKSYKGREISLNSIFLVLPVSFLLGSLLMGWSSYILACVFRNAADALLIADEIVMLFFLVADSVGLIFIFKNKIYKGHFSAAISTPELIVFLLISLLAWFIMHISFSVSHGHMYVGLTVFSDFTPHLSMIRSFSYGSNFPTQYSVCAGDDVKYHFLFQFFIGNLEHLGMRLDYAFNLPSILGMIGAYSLLYVLAVKISGKKSVGYISLLLFTFRSSFSLISFLADVPRGESIIEALKKNTDFLGSTANENWGLWNLNVYCNQRHLLFAVMGLLTAVMLFLPLLYKAADRLSECVADYGKVEGPEGEMAVEAREKSRRKGIFSSLAVYIGVYFKNSIFCREGWHIEDAASAVAAGIMLGALGFWNGAVLIITVLILFFMAAGSDRRGEYIITAAIAGGLSLIQTKTFINGGAMTFSYYYGFLSDNKNFFSCLEYLLKLMGILPAFLLIVFAVSKGTRRYIMICFSMPIIFAFTCSLTPDIAVNHKYIMLSVMLLDIFAACFIVIMFSSKSYVLKFISICLVLTMTSTGIYDFRVLVKRNDTANSMVYELEDEISGWIRDNTDSDDLFLSANYYLTNGGTGSSVILSGAMLYNAWQYFGWSAGYDTAARDMVVAEAYSATDPEVLQEVLNENNIDYVIIDYYNRTSADYQLNEEIFDENYPVVFRSGIGERNFKIYKVR